MTNRVNVNITARDLTRGELQRMRRNFRDLGTDLDRMVSNRSRQNFARLGDSIRATRRDLNSLRGNIPDDEFFRLDTAMRQAQRTMSRGFNRVGANQLAQIRRQVDEVRQGFRDLDESGQIRIRVDLSALRRADARLDAWRARQARNAVRVPVRPDIQSGSFRRTLVNALTSPFRTAGRLLGGTLSDGIGQGLSNAFRGAGPVMGAVLAAAIVAALGVVGGALSGLLVTILGAAFVGIGGVSAAMSQEVKDHWAKTLEGLKKNFADVGKPMIPVLENALDKLTEMADKATPRLKKGIEDTVPATEKFIDALMEGFASFGKAAFDPIMDAWNVFAPVFGEEWNEFMDELGNSFGRMADLVREHPTEIAAALDVVFEAIDLLIDTITFFGKVWVFALQTAGDALGFLLKGVQMFTATVLDAFGLVLKGMVAAFGDIPLIGGKLKQAQGAFQEFRDGVVGKLGEMADAAFGWDTELNNANRKRTLEADISTWQHKLEIARADLKKTSSQKAKAKLEADISDLKAKVSVAWQELARIDGKNAVAYITTYSNTYRSVHDIVGKAHGGVRGLSTAATGGARSNMTLVGEQGPEIVDLAPGSRVRSNADSRRLAAGGGGGGGVPQQINLVVDGKTLARVLIDPVRGVIRDGGGNVQDFLGQRGR